MSKKSAPGKSKNVKVNIGSVIDFLHSHLSRALCNTVYRKERTIEREREWTLFNLVKFWTAVILKAPPSLTQALDECRAGKTGLLPMVDTTPVAFFQRCRDLKPVFFARVYEAFIHSIVPAVPSAFASELAGLRERFSEVWIIDGSRLAKIAHRLKILRNIKKVVLPGCMIACYDIFRGIARIVHVSTDAAKSEHRHAEEIIADVPKGTLLAGDRLYATIQFMRKLAIHGLYGVFRRNRLLKVKKVGPTPGSKKGRNYPKDDLVVIGCGVTQPKMTVRRIKIPGLELFTNVLDPRKLSAEEALLLYRVRWQVERLFYDLKEVLNLNRFYTGSPRSVVMQVYATALVHAAMRVAQAQVADAAGLIPETLSPKKLFPRIAVASIHRIESELVFAWTQQVNAGTKLIEPNWHELSTAQVRLDSILVEHRTGKRRKRKFLPSRKRWTSMPKIPGSRKLS